MTFLAPIAGLIAAALALPALVLLYFLKLRRKPMMVSSTMLWRRAIADMQVNAPFQKLRKNLLLLLQLLILLALLFALARPAMRGPASDGSQVAILIDTSAPMNATDENPSRLEKAKQEALEIVEQIGGWNSGSTNEGAQKNRSFAGAMLVTFDSQAHVLQPMTNDRGLLRAAIESITPTDRVGKLGPALALVEPYAVGAQSESHGSDKGIVVYVMSCGRYADDEPLSLRGAELRYVRIGKHEAGNVADNLGIVSLAAKRDQLDPSRVQVLANLMNYGQKPVTTNLTLTVDERVERVLKVVVPPTELPEKRGGNANKNTSANTGSVTTRLAAGGADAGGFAVEMQLKMPESGVLRLAHDHADDLAADNSAALVVAPPRKLRVLLVSDRSNIFLERAIRASGVERLQLATGKQYEATDARMLVRGINPNDAVLGFDVLVFDGVSPTKQPPMPALYFHAVPPVEGLKLLRENAGSNRSQPVLDWRRDDVVLRYVAMDDLLMDDPDRLVLPDQASVLATSLRGPVMARVAQRGVRSIVMGFDLVRTNWPLQVSFAVFVDNALQDLGLGGAGVGRSFSPGDVAVVPALNVGNVAAGGAGKSVVFNGPEYLTATAEEGRATLPMFRRAGIYRSKTVSDPQWATIAVNLCSEIGSDVRPAARLEVGTMAIEAQSGSEVVRREIWRWFVIGALVVLMIEWVVYTRRLQI